MRRLRLHAAWLLAICFFWLARPDSTSLLVGGTLVVAGLGVRAWAAGVLEKDQQLAVSGPYAFTRNPLYFGSFVVGTGAAVAGGVVWFVPVVAVFFAWVYGATMKQEARELEARFGDGYARYRRAVPLFFPRPTPYHRHFESESECGSAKSSPAKSSSAKSSSGKSSSANSLPANSPPFSMRRYARNKEYEAAMGAAAGFAILASKAAGWWG